MVRLMFISPLYDVTKSRKCFDSVISVDLRIFQKIFVDFFGFLARCTRIFGVIHPSENVLAAIFNVIVHVSSPEDHAIFFVISSDFRCHLLRQKYRDSCTKSKYGK